MGIALLALGLVLLLEGLAYALAPWLIERMLEAMRALPDHAVRQLGGLAMVLGLVLIWLAFQLGGF